MRQDFSGLELIVIDNGSNDDTKQLARKFTEQIYDCGPERSAQRNFGANIAQGRYLLYLDADMALAPTVIRECVQKMQQEPSLIGLYIPERIVGEGFWIKVRDFERRFYDATVIDAVRFVDREAAMAIGGFDARLFGGEDWDFDKRLRQRGHVAAIKAQLYHDEGRFDLNRYLAKKSYYAGSLDAYVQKWGLNDADVSKQLSWIYRFFGVFFENGKFVRLILHPVLTTAMYYLRVRVGIRYLRRRNRTGDT